MSTNRLNIDSFYSAREQEQEQEYTPIEAQYEDTKEVTTIIPKSVERCEGWNDIEIIGLQIDKNGKFPPRLVAQCIGNEDKDYRFSLYLSKNSKFIKALKNKGLLKEGVFKWSAYIGTKWQVLFTIDIIDKRTVFVVDDVQEFTL